jgi:hypothetical protein
LGILCTSGSGASGVFVGNRAGNFTATGASNVCVGANSGDALTSGANNVFIGASAGNAETTGSGSICIGVNSDVTAGAKDRVAIGNGVVATLDDSVFFSSLLTASAPATDANFSGANGGRLFPVSSTARVKKNIVDLAEEYDSSNIYNLRPVIYTHKTDETPTRHIGLIAEEVAEVAPHLAVMDRFVDPKTGKKEDKKSPCSVRYSLLPVLLLEEVKKQKKQLEEAHDLISKLALRLSALEARS